MIRTTPVDEKGMSKEIGAINGGMTKRQYPVTSPLFTIGAGDIDDAMKNVKKIGGEIVRGKMRAEEFGYAAYFKDMEGNIIGPW